MWQHQQQEANEKGHQQKYETHTRSGTELHFHRCGGVESLGAHASTATYLSLSIAASTLLVVRCGGVSRHPTRRHSLCYAVLEHGRWCIFFSFFAFDSTLVICAVDERGFRGRRKLVLAFVCILSFLKKYNYHLRVWTGDDWRIQMQLFEVGQRWGRDPF